MSSLVQLFSASCIFCIFWFVDIFRHLYVYFFFLFSFMFIIAFHDFHPFIILSLLYIHFLFSSYISLIILIITIIKRWNGNSRISKPHWNVHQRAHRLGPQFKSIQTHSFNGWGSLSLVAIHSFLLCYWVVYLLSSSLFQIFILFFIFFFVFFFFLLCEKCYFDWLDIVNDKTGRFAGPCIFRMLFLSQNGNYYY